MYYETHVDPIDTEDYNFARDGNNEFLRRYSTPGVTIWRYPIQDHLPTRELWEVNVITPIVYGPPVSQIDLSISQENVKDIHVTAPETTTRFSRKTGHHSRETKIISKHL